MTRAAPEPARLYWAAGIAVSLLVHTSAVAGAALLAGRFATERQPTEITFTDESSPVADPEREEADRAPPVADVQRVEQETLAATPATRSDTAAASEAVTPLDAEVTRPAQTAALTPETAEALQVDRASPVLAPQPSQSEVVSQPPTASLQPTDTTAAAAQPVQPLPADQPAGRETLAAAQAESAGAVPPASVAPAALGETLPNTETVTAAPPAERESVAAEQGRETLSSSPAEVTVAAPGNEAAPTVSALDRLDNVGMPQTVVPDEQQPETAAVDNGAAETVVALPPSPPGAGVATPTETLQPAPQSGAAGTATTDVETVRPAAAPITSAAEPSAATQVAQPISPSAGSTASEALVAPSVSSGVAATASTATGAGTSPSTTAPAASAAKVEPIAPSAGNVASLAPEVLSPPLSAGAVIGAGTVPPTAAPDAVAPAQPETAQPAETALLTPARPDSVPATDAASPAERYRKVVDFLRAYADGDCFIALPEMAPEGAITFETFGRDQAHEQAFRQALADIDEPKAEIDGADIADPQCQALSFTRAMQRYPDFSLAIDLDEAAMARGNTLSGSVLNVGGRELHLLLVDEEGRVQSIDAAPSAGNGSVRTFSVPLSSSGGQPLGTEQILMAITADPPLKIISVNEPAARFLPFLARYIASSGADVDVAVKGFTLR